MAQTMEDILHPGGADSDSQFPYAPANWSTTVAVEVANDEGLELNDSHWDMIRALQEYFSRNDGESIQSRELHDALEEKFHSQGGMKYLYQLLPGGPVSQGCRLAGLRAPAGSSDGGFGSVQ